jgi:hypothetical protein
MHCRTGGSRVIFSSDLVYWCRPECVVREAPRHRALRLHRGVDGSSTSYLMVCNMNLRRYFWMSLCALTVVCSAQIVNAAAVVGSMSEPFAYPDATAFATQTLPSTTNNGGLGFNATGTTAANDPNAAWGGTLTAGNGAKIVNVPGLTYSATGYLAPTGGKLTVDGATLNSTTNVGRNLGQTIDTGTTFFSLLMARNTADTIRTFNMAFENGTSEQLTIGQIGAAAGNSNGNIALLMNNVNPGGLVQAATPIAMGNNITHLIIGRVDWNAGPVNATNAALTNEIVTLWVDPTNVTTQAAAGNAYLTTNAFDDTGMSAIRPFAGSTVAAGANNIAMPAVSGSFDELRVGGTWASVTSAAVVPEPATIILAGLGFAGLFGLARRGRNAA